MVSVLSVGCPMVVPYQPDEGLVGEIGPKRARQILEETLLRALTPRILDAHVTNKFMHYRYQVGLTSFDARVYFQNVGRVEIFDNNYVFLRTAGEVVLAQILFANDGDAKTFADLVTSFRAQRFDESG
jgi:hypothetical protein